MKVISEILMTNWVWKTEEKKWNITKNLSFENWEDILTERDE